MADLAKLDERLRCVEQDVGIIKERLTHMPNKADLWKALAWAGGLTLAAIGSGGLWIIQQYLSPILQKLAQ